MKKTLYCLTLATALSCTAMAQAEVFVSVNIAPPALPIYVQPPIPGDGYMWTPGYWSWNPDDNDYYWVPGTWVAAPFVGALWTPGYWGWADNGYAWHRGYWGSQIGYYGGINYGFGYTGHGYQGGHWDHGAFNYNRSVNNVNDAHIGHVYNSPVRAAPVTRVSYNGGHGGIRAQPTRGEQSVASMPHTELTAPQAQHEQAARGNQALRASVNHGMPKIAATPQPGAFTAPNVAAARAEQAQQVAHIRGQNEQRAQAAQPPQAMPPHQQRTQQMPQQHPQQMPQPQRQAPAMPQQQHAAQRPMPHPEAPHGEERHDK
jgi:hypothetical protein